MTDESSLAKLNKLTESVAKHVSEGMKPTPVELATLKMFQENESSLERMLDYKSSIQDSLERASSTARLLKEMSNTNINSARALAEKIALEQDINDKIFQQQKMLSSYALSEGRLPIVAISKIKAPMEETNNHLANIDERFDRIERIAMDSAQIATNIQQSAVDFLIQFKQASIDNDKSVKKTIALGKIAIFVALLTAALPIFYSVWKDQKDAVQTQYIISDLINELHLSKEAQVEASRKLIKALNSSDLAVVSVLQEIKAELAKRDTASSLKSK